MKPRGLLVIFTLPMVLVLLAGYFGGLMLYGSQNWSLHNGGIPDDSVEAQMRYSYFSVLYALQAVAHSLNNDAAWNLPDAALGIGIGSLGLGVIVLLFSCLPLYISKKGAMNVVGTTLSWIYSFIFVGLVVIFFWFTYSAYNQNNEVDGFPYPVPFVNFIQPIEYGIWPVFGLTILLLFSNVFGSIYATQMRAFAKLDRPKKIVAPAPQKPAPQKPTAVPTPTRSKAQPKPTVSRTAPARTAPTKTPTSEPARKPASGIKSDYDRIWNATKSTRDDFIKQTERVKGDSAKKKAAPVKKTPADKLKNKWSQESKKVYSK